MVGTRSGIRVLVAGGAGFIGSHLIDALLADGARVTCVDSLLTGRRANLAHLANEARFDFVEADVTEPLPALPRFDWGVQPRLRGLAAALPGRPGPHDDDQRAGHRPAAGGRPGRRGALPPGLDQRGLRRSGAAPAAGILLGQRQPDRAAGLLRRGQALRRDPDLRFRAPARPRHPRRADLQHLRPADARRRRPGRFQRDLPSPRGRRHHGLRQRRADPLLLLRQRLGGRAPPADGRGDAPRRPGQPRQPPRADGRRAGRPRGADDRDPRPGSCAGRCRWTIPSAAGRTSPAPRPCSAGRPGCPWRRGWRRRSRGSPARSPRAGPVRPSRSAPLSPAEPRPGRPRR
jgi:hypothetical protein